MTYEELYKKAIKNIANETKIIDWRPCCTMFGVPNIPNAIVMWLDDGNKIIYCEEEE